MFKDGRPYSIENGCIDARLITEHSEEEQSKVYDWICENIIEGNRKNSKHTSYGMKHILQRNTGIYLTNNEFKDAMLHMGFLPTDPDKLNWTYKIKESSPAFKFKKVLK